jgi:glycogen operon protein
VIEYRVDGFRFDLASILGRNEDGSPMNKPPLLQSLAFDPILGNVKLIAEAWDAAGLYQVGTFPAWNRWAEWNGKYRDDLRRFLKGDGGLAQAAARRMTGSPDLYDPLQRGPGASINFLTCHDGFPLRDIYTYQHKHNEENGWNNTDGANDNNSWNCGVEGETDDPQINALRARMIRNAAAVLLCSRGTPMFLMGDEFGNTQCGNNNAYCQDSPISWLDWDLLETNRDLFDFFKYMIAFRHRHTVIRRTTAPCSCGFPEISFHGEKAWGANLGQDSHLVAILFAGRDEDGKDDLVYLGVNAHWEDHTLELPPLPAHLFWQLEINTGEANSRDCLPHPDRPLFTPEGGLWVGPRSVVVLTVASPPVHSA